MAVFFAATSGNWSDPNTWRVVATPSYLNIENSSQTLATSVQTSNVFSFSTPTIVEGVGIKVGSRPAASGGLWSVRLTEKGNTVTGSQVNLAVTDTENINATGTIPSTSGWQYLKFATPISLSAGLTYGVSATSSAPTIVALMRPAGVGSNWLRALVTNISGVPGNGDSAIISGQHTAPGVGVDYVVTYDGTGSVTYGGVTISTQLSFDINPSSTVATLNNLAPVEIGRRGVLNFGTNPSTDYIFNARGPIIVGPGGTFTIGTQGNPIPSSSTATIRFTQSTVGTVHGVHVRTFGTFISYGATKSGRAILGATALSAATTLVTTTNTGWLANDNLGIAPGTISSTLFDLATMSVNAVGTNITLTRGINSIKPTWPGTKVEVEVINLTRNVRIIGASSAVPANNRTSGRNVVNCNFTEFRFSNWLQGALAGFAGTNDVSGGSFSLFGSSVWGSPTVNVYSLAANQNSGLQYSFSLRDTVMFNMNGLMISPPLYSFNPNNSYLVFLENVWAIGAVSYWFVTNNSVSTVQPNFRIEKCRFIASQQGGVILGNGNRADFPLYIKDSVFKCSLIGLGFGAGSGCITFTKTHDISDNLLYFNTTGFRQAGGTLGNSSGWVIGRFDAFSNTIGLDLGGTTDGMVYLGATMSRGPLPAAGTIGVRLGPSSYNNILENFYIDGLGADVLLFASVNACQVTFINSTFGSNRFTSSFGITASTGPIIPQLSSINGISFKSMRHNGIDNNHFELKSQGVIRTDSVIFRSPMRSIRLSPHFSTRKLETPTILVPVKQSQSITIGVWVRTSVVGDASGVLYNGNFPRLLLKQNFLTGNSSDYILATASGDASGNWQYISGVTPVALNDTAFEVVVDCDGTLGWVNVDDVSVSSQNSTKGFKYWSNGSPVPSSTTQNGSSVIIL